MYDSASASPILDLARKRAGQRGFTLIEMIIVVLIIGVLAVLAIPSISSRMRDRRTQQVAHEVANVYRMARMRAMGRGSAVLVRYDVAKAPAPFQVREAVMGAGAPLPGCAPTPASSCTLTNWDPVAAASMVVQGLDVTFFTGYTDPVVVEMRDAAPLPAIQAQMDVCFSPMGRTFIRFQSAPGTPFTQLAGIPTALVYRTASDGSGKTGIDRTVFILPNGSARLGL